MHATPFEIAPPVAQEALPGGFEHEALLIQLQRQGAFDVDKGLNLLLQALLAITHARHVTCTLVDSSAEFGPEPIVSQSAGLCSVEGAPAHGGCSTLIEYEIRPGRSLRLDFVPPRAEHAISGSAVGLLLRALHRWLIWLDLSFGPVNEKGSMPRHHRRVLLLLLKGLSEKQIAADLDQSIHTTHQYVKALYRRFGVRNRASLMSLWLNPVV